MMQKKRARLLAVVTAVALGVLLIATQFDQQVHYVNPGTLNHHFFWRRGWYYDGTDWVYVRGGRKVTGSQKINGVQYHFRADGRQILPYRVSRQYELTSSQGSNQRATPKYIILHDVGSRATGQQAASFMQRTANSNQAYQNFDRVRVFAGVPELITQLASQSGTRLAIVTSKTRAEYRQYFQNQYEFAKYFSVVVTADDTQLHKPSAEPILLALARLGAQPVTAVYVGDMLTDFIAAHAAKIKFAGADYGSEDPQKIADADFHLASLAGLIRLNGEGVVQS